MSFLLWTVPLLMAFALIPWINNNFPTRRILVTGLLVLAICIGSWLSYLGFWQTIPATILSAVWLATLGVRSMMKRPSKRQLHYYSGTLFTLFLIIGIAPIYSAPIQDLPTPDGPYAVGMKEFVVTDRSRLGLRGAPADAPRRILVRAYYPAEHVEGLRRRPYLTSREASLMAEAATSLGQPGFMDSYKQHALTNTYDNAPIALGQKFPFVLFSHGFTGPMAENLFIVENMVSKGYVVFMTSHPGNTRFVAYPDGTKHLIDASITEIMSQSFSSAANGPAPIYATLDDFWDANVQYQFSSLPLFVKSMAIWRDDMLAVADALFSGNVDAAIASIWQSVDQEKFAYVGMSFGASTAATTCHVDTRCTAAILLDGVNADKSLVNAQIRMPAMSVQAPLGTFPGTENQMGLGLSGMNDTSYEPVALAGQSGLVTRVTVRDTKHLSYTDNASFWRGPIRSVFLVGMLPKSETNTAINGLISAFLDEQLNGKPGTTQAFIDGNADANTYSLDALSDWAQGKGL